VVKTPVVIIGIAQIGQEADGLLVASKAERARVDADGDDIVLAISLLQVVNLVRSGRTVGAPLTREVLDEHLAGCIGGLDIDEAILLVEVAARRQNAPKEHTGSSHLHITNEFTCIACHTFVSPYDR